MDTVQRRLAAIAVFSLAVQIFIFRQGGSVAGVLFFAFLFALVVGLFGSFKRITTPSIESYSAMALAALSILSLATDGMFRHFLIYVGMMGILFYSAYSLLRSYHPRGFIESLLSVPQLVGHYLTQGVRLVTGSFFEQLPLRTSSSQSTSRWRPLVVGFIIGLPVVIWMTALLTSGDPIFARFIQSIFDGEFFARLPVRFLISCLAFIALLPTVFMALDKPYTSPLGFLTRSSYGREVVVILTMVSLVLGSFVVIEWPYVFAQVAAETSLAHYGVATYSEYVKRGFMELVMVAGIVTLLSWVTLYVYRGERERRIQKIILSLQILLGLESFIFVVSIVRRVYLYTTYHGLSLARFYGMAFLIWLVGMGVLLALRYRRSYVSKGYEVGWSVLVYVATILINTHALVVRYPPTVNGRTDYVYLSRLSVEGYEGWKQAYAWARNVIEREEKTQGIIGSEGRREIAYAQNIINSIRFHSIEYGRIYDGEDIPDGSLTRLDRLYSWNALRMSVYRQMKNDMPRAQLDDLEARSRALVDRIYRQPSNERSIEYDVSLNAPLL